MLRGYVVFVLHAHLPYVLSHGKWPHGSDWLCEAACETYIPLLRVLDRLSADGKKANLTIDITPVLCEMLASNLFRKELKDYIEQKRCAAIEDRAYFEGRGDKAMASLASDWQAFYDRSFFDFTERYGEDLIGGFRRCQEEGQIEIITSAASHAYLPLLGLDSSVAAQIMQGVETYRKHFMRTPRGIWLPECAYRPGCMGKGGLEGFLAGKGIDYFFVDGHMLHGEVTRRVRRESGTTAARSPSTGMRYQEPVLQAFFAIKDRKPAEAAKGRSIYRAYYTGSGTGRCAFFPRDAATSMQVWSAQWGYPGDPYYLEFHKKRSPGGLRYWRVTDRESLLGDKVPYDAGHAAERVRSHAEHFKRLVQERLEEHLLKTRKPGVLSLPFDAELFGHWWFEGIEWMYTLFSAFDEKYVTIKASEALEHASPLKTISLPEGSWGEGGRHHIWYNEETAWTWDRIHEAERDMTEDLRLRGDDDAVGSRIMKQMGRELFLMQSSDWQFLMTNRTAEDYAKSRLAAHYEAFKDLRNILKRYRNYGSLAAGDREVLCMLESKDAVFDNIKLQWFEETV